MRALAIALVLAATAVACDGGLVAELTKFRDRACACADRACVEAVNRDLEAWIETKKDVDPEPSEVRDLMRVADEYVRCYMKHAGPDAKLPTNLPAEMPEGGLPGTP